MKKETSKSHFKQGQTVFFKDHLESLSGKSYEDVLATVIINKVVTKKYIFFHIMVNLRKLLFLTTYCFYCMQINFSMKNNNKFYGLFCHISQILSPYLYFKEILRFIKEGIIRKGNFLVSDLWTFPRPPKRSKMWNFRKNMKKGTP